MWLLRTCEEYIGFDDRKMIAFGIVIVSIITHPILFGLSYSNFFTSPLIIIESMIWTSVYWLVLRWMMIYLRRRLPNISDNPKRIIISLLIVLTLAPILSVCIAKVCGFIFPQDIEHSRTLKYTLIYILAIGIMAIYEAAYYFHQYKCAIKETEALKTQQVQTQLENLRNQVSPHFLFNSLNTLMNLIPKDQDRAMIYLSKLSKF